MPTGTACIECRQPLTDGKCVNTNCSRAAAAASRGADRSTAKQTVGAAVGGSPAAWNISGGVD